MAEKDISDKMNRALSLQGEYIGMLKIQAEVSKIVNQKEAEYEKLKKEVM